MNPGACAPAPHEEEETMTARRSILVLALALAGCAGAKVNTQYDPGAPFGSYKTYAWLATQPGAEQAATVRDPGARQLIVNAVDREMARKGFTRTTPDANPDLFVSVIGWAQQRVEVSNYGYAYGGAYTYGPYGPGYAVPVAQVNQYTDGTLLLDFVDAKTRQLVWRGTATDTVTSLDQLKGTIDEAARKLLEAYPPQKK
jgi:hypothetical protein